MDQSEQLREVDRNYGAFQRSLALYLPDHRGEYALMRNGAVIAFFLKPGDAYRDGVAKYEDGLFSVQEMTDEPIDLGLWSHVQHWSGMT